MIDNKVEEIKKHFAEIMRIMDIEVTDSTELTPLRVAKMYCNEIFANRNNYNIGALHSQMTVFKADNRNPVSVTVPFFSTCEHHFMPFYGEVFVTYVPGELMIGLSKIPRVVKFFSKKPQVQERLTQEIGEYLVKVIKPKMLSVRIKANHTCVSARGIESPCDTVTVFEYSTEGDKNEYPIV